MKIRCIDDMYGKEGQTIRLELNGRPITRKVRYNHTDGLFVVIRNYKIFEYDFRYRDIIDFPEV